MLRGCTFVSSGIFFLHLHFRVHLLLSVPQPQALHVRYGRFIAFQPDTFCAPARTSAYGRRDFSSVHHAEHGTRANLPLAMVRGQLAPELATKV